MNTSSLKCRGITALVAVMVMSVALTLGVGIFQLLYAEMLISRDTAHSVVAEYAAEAGVECAKYNIFAKDYDFNTAPSMWCNGNNLGVARSMNELTFEPYHMTESGACAVVNMSYVDSGTTRTIFIQSHGRYPCDNPRVERGIETSLQRGI